MNRKRAEGLQVEEIPSNESTTVTTPEKAKMPRQNEGEPFDNDEEWNEDDLAAIDLSVVAMQRQRTKQQHHPTSATIIETTTHLNSASTSLLDKSEVNDFDDESLNDDDLAAIDRSVAATMDCKPAAAPTAIVTPEKAIEVSDPNLSEDDSSNRVTADAVMGFGKHSNATYREIMTQQSEYVNWAKSKKDSARGKLKDFLEWVESPEGKSLELEAPGSFPKAGAAMERSYEPSTETTLSSENISCFLEGAANVKEEHNSNISNQTFARRVDCAAVAAADAGGGSSADHEPAQSGSSQLPIKLDFETVVYHRSNDNAEEGSKLGHADHFYCDIAGTKKRQSTLTQDFLEEAAHTKKVARNEHFKRHDGELKSVEIKKPGTLKESIICSRGEVWESADYEGCAVTLGDIRAYNLEYEAEIKEMWMKLEYTFIGSNQAATIKEKLGGDWVLLEKHELMSNNGRIKVNTLRNKLADARKPTTYYIEDGSSVSYSHFGKHGNQKILQQHTTDRPIALDIFAGGGGMSIGLERAGWNVKYKIEMNAACCETLKTNFKGKKIFKDDVAKFSQELKSGGLNIDTKNIALIHGSPPCQGFSLASKCFCFDEIWRAPH